MHNKTKEFFFQAMYGEKCVGAIVCKLDVHKKVVRRGYIAMLAVDENYRQEKIGKVWPQECTVDSILSRKSPPKNTKPISFLSE